MAKRYDYTGGVAPGTRGRAVSVSDELEKIEAAFDTFPDANEDGTGFEGALPVGPAVDPEDALQLQQFLTWSFNVNANMHKLYNLASPTAAGDATNKTYVDSAIAAALLIGGNPGDIGITEMGIGTATAGQAIRVNLAGTGIEGYNLTIGTIGVTGLTAGFPLRVNESGTAVESFDSRRTNAAAAVYAYLYL